MGSFVIHKRGKAGYYAALMTANGDVILRGTDCANLMDCKNSINYRHSHY